MQKKSELGYKLAMWLVIFISMIIAVLFCNKKQGFHYDENYSYYSTNVTYGLYPNDYEWKSVDQIKSEFMVNQGETLNLGMVKLSQSYDVHPPLYYYALRVVCFLTKNTYSKWQGLYINLVFYFVCLLLLWKIADIAGNGNRLINLFSLAIFGLSPGYLSTVTFIRMYVMLTMLCFALLLIAMNAFKKESFGWKNCFIPTALLCCLGFLTHYYFIIFAFFVAAYTCLYLVFHKDTRAKAFIYGGSVCVGLMAAVLYYPACVSHIFSGYRGTEATQAFMDASNTFDRINFFVQLLNDFTFSGALYVLVLICILIYMFYVYSSKSKQFRNTAREQENTKEVSKTSAKIKPEMWLLVVTTIGYFILVCKTGMMPSNPAEALRYECPSYGLIIVLVTVILVSLSGRVGANKLVPIAILTGTLVCQVFGLINDKVFFIYSDSTMNYEWARANSDSDIVYIYNPNNSWMIWNDSPELMEYNDIYFIPMTDEGNVEDERLANDGTIFVYACRADEANEIMQRLVDGNDNFNSFEKVAERLYVDIYELK